MILTRAQKVRLGAFLLAGTILLVGGIMSLAGLKVLEKRDVYSVRYSESVSGLEPSASVKFQGLRVGSVQSMAIAKDDANSIEVFLSLEPGTPLHEGTKAVLDASGITGLKTINLTPGDPRQPKLQPGSRIPAGESFLDRVTGKAEAVIVKAEVIANQLAKWTGDDNRLRLERTIESLDRLVNDLDKTVNESRKPLVSALEAIDTVSRRTAKLETESITTLTVFRTELQKTAESTRLALKAIERTAADVDGKEVTAAVTATKNAMNSLDQRLSATETQEAIAELQKTLKQTSHLLQELDLVVRAGREDFVASLSYIRQAAEDLREFSRIIAQDPSVLLRGQEVTE